MLRDALLDLAHALEGLIPAPLELVGDKTVLGVGRIVLALCALGGVAGGLEIALEGAAHLILLLRFVSVRQDRCLDGGRLHGAQDFGSYRRIDPRTAEADAARLAFVEPGAVTDIARHIASAASVVHGELRGAAPTTQETRAHGAPGAARPGRAGGELPVPVDRTLDALESLPVDIALVGVWDQRQPALARLPSVALACLAAHVVSAALGLAIRVGTPVDRVREQPVERAVSRALPVDFPTGCCGRQLQTVLEKPQQRLPDRADPLELIEHQPDRRVQEAIRLVFRLPLSPSSSR